MSKVTKTQYKGYPSSHCKNYFYKQEQRLLFSYVSIQRNFTHKEM